jgi:hypothetical protein
MKLITASSYGDPEVLRVEERPARQPQADVLVEVTAAGVNLTAILLISFTAPSPISGVRGLAHEPTGAQRQGVRPFGGQRAHAVARGAGCGGRCGRARAESCRWGRVPAAAWRPRVGVCGSARVSAHDAICRQSGRGRRRCFAPALGAHRNCGPTLVSHPAGDKRVPAGTANGAASGSGRHDRACYLGDRHMGHRLGPPGSWISSVTSTPCRR